MNITITDSAAAKVADLLSENPDEKALRIYVQGGGCSGFQYGFAFESEFAEDDFQLVKNGTTFIIDAMSAQYMEGAEINYKEELMGASFEINNPNAQTTCGCGSSFSV